MTIHRKLLVLAALALALLGGAATAATARSHHGARLEAGSGWDDRNPGGRGG